MRLGMDSIPLTRLAVLRGVVAFLSRIGTPVDGLLEQVGLRPEVFDEEEGLIPLRLGMRFMELAARTEGMLTDPVYEGKSMAGLIGMVRAGEIPAGSRVLYAHLGGQPALSAYAHTPGLGG